MQETWVRSLDWEDTLEKGRATHSSILAWRIPDLNWSLCTYLQSLPVGFPHLVADEGILHFKKSVLRPLYHFNDKIKISSLISVFCRTMLLSISLARNTPVITSPSMLTIAIFPPIPGPLYICYLSMLSSPLLNKLLLLLHFSIEVYCEESPLNLQTVCFHGNMFSWFLISSFMALISVCNNDPNEYFIIKLISLFSTMLRPHMSNYICYAPPWVFPDGSV